MTGEEGTEEEEDSFSFYCELTVAPAVQLALDGT